MPFLLPVCHCRSKRLPDKMPDYGTTRHTDSCRYGLSCRLGQVLIFPSVRYGKGWI